jgi:hypothetical protein
MNSEMLDAKLRDQHRDLKMMREVMGGRAIANVASDYGLSPRTCRNRVNTIGTTMMRAVMAATQGDPEHPSTVRFTVEEFTNNPRGCLKAMMDDTIRELEQQFPALK